MDNKKMAKFISELRNEKNLTQKNLAEQLGITDKAVSKWERGLSCPDISLLPKLSEILDITISELLNGEKTNVSTPELETMVKTTIKYADKQKKKMLTKITRKYLLYLLSIFGFGVLIFFLLIFGVTSKNTFIDGYVYDSITKEPLENVDINDGNFTDKEGYFVLNPSETVKIIEISKKGYETKKIEFYPGEYAKKIYLEPESDN